jgi:hypothetical protein
MSMFDLLAKSRRLLRWAVLPLTFLPLVAQAQWRVEGGPTWSDTAAYDQARAELVSVCADDTWVYDGNRWQRRASPSALRNRTEVALGYDEGRRCVVLFGGRIGTAPQVDTWEWDGSSWTFRNSNSQLASQRSVMAFDAARNRLVRHGMDQNGFWRLWDWDGATWTQLGTSLQNLYAMVYDGGSSRLLAHDNQHLYGWNGTAWTVVAYGVIPTVGYTSSLLAYDRSRNVVVLTRGSATGIDVFEWNGITFVAHPSPTSPLGRTTWTPVYDTVRQRVVVHAGFDSNRPMSHIDTWEWDGVQWHEYISAPPTRTVPTLAFTNVAHAADRNRLVLWQSAAGNDPRAGTWEWDGQRWWHMAPIQQPQAPANGPLTYDSLRQRILLVAGGTAATLTTWAYDGITWTQLPTANAPSDRRGQELAYDAARDQVVLFGGNTTNDTWLFDGVNWHQQTPATSPGINAGHKLVYDEVRQEVVMFTVSGQTWTWNGSTWALRTVVGAPSSRIGFGMAWDPARQRTALTGGANPNYQPTGWVLRPAGLWEWDGNAWAQRATTGLSPVMAITLAHTADSLVLFGGIVNNNSTDQLLRLVDAPLALASEYGAGCPGTHGNPLIAADFLPYVGHTSFGLQLTSLPAQAPALMAFGFASGAAALGNGCTQLVAGGLNVQFTFADAGGMARFPLPIPADPAFLNIHIFAQGAAIDPNGALGGIALSRGIDLLLGN